MREDAKRDVCAEIQAIMETYREQEERDSIGTPGGIEHLGDVWRLLRRWDDMLSVPPTLSDPEIIRILRCSTSNLKTDLKEDAQSVAGLLEYSDDDVAEFTCRPWRDGNTPEDASNELNAIMRYAVELGCDRVQFDPDGPELRGFPVFEETDEEDGPC